MSDAAAIVSSGHEGPCGAVVCVVLASGQGTRMGGPKALLLWEGVPLAVAHVRMRRAQGIETVVVTRTTMAAPLLRFDPTLRVVVSEAPEEQGPAGSIAACVRAGVIEDHACALLVPVDLVPPRNTTLTALCNALQDDTDAVVPRYEGRGGHPVLIRAKALTSAYGREPPPILRDVLAGMGERRVFVPVDDADVRADLDTPEAWKDRTGRSPCFWT